MKRYRYVVPGEDDQPITIEVTEQEILEQYWEYWSERMRYIGRDEFISEERCIKDFLVVHWAEEVR